jgi:2,4-dienoyl-CoA reductase-like NADH-dependent reductase (Old Yellow Enzyme family)
MEKKLKSLFSHIKIGTTTLKNRLVFPSMCTGYSDDSGSITLRIKAFVEARAAGGVGMCTVPGAVYGSPCKDRPSIADDSYIQGWNDLKTLLSGYGVKLFCQLHPDPRNHKKPEDYTVDQIQELIRVFGTAACRVKEAGLDGIEIHGINHEIALFLSPFYNHRRDGYGDGLETRARFALEILRAVKEAVGPNLPVIFKLSIDERIHGGRDVAESLMLVRLLEDAGADAIHATVGSPESMYWQKSPPEVPAGYGVPLAAEVKRVVSIPVISVGRINDLRLAAKVVQEGNADLVAIGRALLADPDLPVKSLEGRYSEIIECTACNLGCGGIGETGVSCSRNHRTGKEYLLIH